MSLEDYQGFNKRFRYGASAEYATFGCYKSIGERCLMVRDYCKENNISWSKEFDKKYGDIVRFEDDKLYFYDIKRNSISIESIEKFEGYGFIMWNDQLTEVYFHSTEAVRRIYKNKPEKLLIHRLSSGDKGINVEMFKKYNTEKAGIFFDILNNS